MTKGLSFREGCKECKMTVGMYALYISYVQGFLSFNLNSPKLGKVC